MARSSAHRTFPQKTPLGDKKKLAGAAFTKGNNIPIVSRAPNPAVAPPVVSVLFSMAQYLEDNLQLILKTVLDFRCFATPLIPVSK